MPSPESPEQPSSLPETSGFLPGWEWTAARYRAAARVADGVITEAEIASEAGITDRQLRTWKKHPAFTELVDAITGEAIAQFKGEAVASKSGRIRILIDLHNKLLAIIEARAVAAKGIALPRGGAAGKSRTDRRIWAAGEETGLIVTKESWGKVYSHEAAHDASLIKSITDLHDRIAREMGQRDDTIRVRHSGRVDHVHRVPQGLRNLTDDELDALSAISAKVHAGETEP